MGLTWDTWLEQGRDIRVSAQVVTGIARALQLEPAERAHLFRLAGHAPPAPEAANDSLTPRLRRIRDSWHPFPAHVAGRRRDILACNRASDLVDGWSQLPEDKRNTLWWAFMVPASRRLMLDWEGETSLAVAGFRSDAGQALFESDYQELINQLLDLEFTIFHIAEQPSLRLYLYTPADERTRFGGVGPDPRRDGPPLDNSARLASPR